MYKAFLVDDEIVIREGIRNNFPWDESGFQLAGEAPDGEIALSMLQDIKPDVLITDIEMPAMDGLALCRALKSDPATREIPVIIFSSLINEQIARKCEEVGADAYITKPQFKELVNLLDAHTAAPEPALA